MNGLNSQAIVALHIGAVMGRQNRGGEIDVVQHEEGREAITCSLHYLQSITIQPQCVSGPNAQSRSGRFWIFIS